MKKLRILETFKNPVLNLLFEKTIEHIDKIKESKIKKLPVKDLSPAYQSKYLISKRHFDSIRKTLEGKVSSILALNKNYGNYIL